VAKELSMLSELFSYLIEHNSVIAICLLLVVITYFITKKVLDYKHTLEETCKKAEDAHKKLATLPCEAHSKAISKLDRLDSISAILTEMAKWIMQIDSSTIDRLTHKFSPYRLTKVGERVLEESYGKKTIDDNLDFLLGKIEGMTPKTPYDVENYAIDVLLENIGKEIFNDVKNYIYYSPGTIPYEIEGKTIDVEISMPKLLRSMSVYLRDKYFKKHPEIGNDPKWRRMMSNPDDR
jgi:hypothetical protein